MIFFSDAKSRRTLAGARGNHSVVTFASRKPSFRYFVLLLLSLGPPLEAAQTANSHGFKAGRIQSIDLTTFGQSLSVQFETWVEQLPRDFAEGVNPVTAPVEEKNGTATIQRIIRDHFHEIQVAYELTLRQDAKGLLASFEPLAAMEGTPSALPRKWMALEPMAAPVPQLIQMGDVLKLVLYERDSGSRLVEYVRIGSTKVSELRAEPPRDSYAEDAEFHLSGAKIRANGQKVTVEAAADFHAPALRVAIPGFGSYVVSLKQHPGFEYAGEVSGDALTFLLGGSLFRIECKDRIAPGSASYNVYVRREDSAVEGSLASIRVETAYGLPSPDLK